MNLHSSFRIQFWDSRTRLTSSDKSSLKSGGSWIQVKKNFGKFRFFQGNVTKNSVFQAKIGLGKLVYFSSKVTTLEYTSCT